MTLQTINVGTVANDRTGDTWRAAFQKINTNITETQAFLDAAGFTFISQESDFAVQTSSTITLEAQEIYVITASFTTTKNFLVEDGSLFTMFNQVSHIVTYSGVGTMFSGTNVSFAIQECSINCPSATAFEFTDTVVNTKFFKAENVSIFSCNKLGTFTGMQNALFLTSASFNSNDGVTYAGTGLVAATMDRMFFGSTSASFIAIDLGTTSVSNLEFDNLIVIAPSGAIGISGTTASANITSGFLGMVTNSSFSGGMTAQLSGIATTDFRWIFRDNTGIADTVQDFLLSFNGSSTETVIATQDVPVLVNAVWTCVRSSIFTCITAGRATSDSERNINGFPVDIAVGLLSAGGGTINASVYLALNGTVITASKTTISISGSNQAFVSVPWQVEVAEDDFFEVFVENNSNTTNIIVESATLRGR